jgi:hypothetical protein
LRPKEKNMDCPFFAEFLPDPVAVADGAGEFIELAWNAPEGCPDSLELRLDGGKATLVLPPCNERATRLLLHRNTLECPHWANLLCASLETPALPNSRASTWSLAARDCRDTAYLPTPKAGQSLQRSDSGWTPATPTPGLPSPLHESVQDCATALVGETIGEMQNKKWQIILNGQGVCASPVHVLASSLDGLFEGEWSVDLAGGTAELPPFPATASLLVEMRTAPDGNPANDSTNTLLVLAGAPPLALTEVAPCPQEPAPEWFEATNASVYPFALAGVSVCGEAPWTGADSLPAGASVLFTKDSAALRAWLGASDIRVRQIKMPALLNRADTLRLCHKGAPLDSVFWLQSSLCDTSLASSPGFVRREEERKGGKILLNRRVLSLAQKKSFQARVDSPLAGRFRLVSRTGKTLWEAAAKPGEWTAVGAWRKCGVGVCNLYWLSEDGNAVASFVVRP